MTELLTSYFQPIFGKTLCKPLYLLNLQHLQVSMYPCARVCAQWCKSPESAESTVSAVSKTKPTNQGD